MRQEREYMPETPNKCDYGIMAGIKNPVYWPNAARGGLVGCLEYPAASWLTGITIMILFLRTGVKK